MALLRVLFNVVLSQSRIAVRWAFLLSLILCHGLLPGARLIEPTETDPDISESNARHYVANPPEAGRQELFVFFLGTGGLPVNYTEIVDHAAGLGYHALALSYVNDESINFDLCAFSEDPECHANARREIKEGVDLSDAIEVAFVNSIDHRLERLISYLHENYPDESWIQFLTESGAIRWSRVAVAGHSQGAGHAGFIAKNHVAVRAVLFAGADVVFGQARPASWVSWPSATPASRIYGFTHAFDQTPSLEISRQMWSRYGIDAFGEETVVEDAADLSGQHRLLTYLEPSDPDNYHGAPVVDFALPRGPDGENLLLETWTHLLTDVRTRPGERLNSLEAPAESWVSPGFHPGDDWMAWQDTDGHLWVSRYDPLTGLPERDGTMEVLDDQLSPVHESRKGPEFITWAGGSVLAYVRSTDGVLAIHAATREGVGWETRRLSPDDGIDRGGPIGTAGSRWERPGLAFWKGDGETGDLCWTWVDGPTWEDNTLGPVLSGSTPVRWAPDGRHLIYTLAVAGVPQLFALDTSSGAATQLTSLPTGIANPVAFLDPLSGGLIVGGVVDETELHLFRLDPGRVAVWLESRTAPLSQVVEGYAKIGSPEAFVFEGRVWISAEIIRGEPGNVPDARIWLLEVLSFDAPLDLRVDDGQPDTRRADPEFYLTDNEIFITYQRHEEGGGVRQDRVRGGLPLFIRAGGLRIDLQKESVLLSWDDAPEPRLMRSDDLLEWTEVQDAVSRQPVPLDGPSKFYQLRPALD